MSMEQQMIVQDNMENEQYLNSFPPGYRFMPTDKELLEFYLKKKIYNEPLPPSKIKEANISVCSPMKLSEEHDRERSGTMYFFTPRKRKSAAGVNADRVAGNGFWKASGKAEKVATFDGLFAYKTSLVYNLKNGKNKAIKTDWLMKELTLTDQPSGLSLDEKLDYWALCNVYRNMRSSRGGDDGRVSFPEGSTKLIESSSQHPQMQRDTQREETSQPPLLQRVISGECSQHHPSIQRLDRGESSKYNSMVQKVASEETSQHQIMQRVTNGESFQHPITQVVVTRGETSQRPNKIQRVTGEGNSQHPLMERVISGEISHLPLTDEGITHRGNFEDPTMHMITCNHCPELDTFLHGLLSSDREDSDPIDFGGVPNLDDNLK